MTKHTKAELLGIVLRLEAIVAEPTLSSVMEINPEGKAESLSGYSVLPMSEVRMRELVLAKTERIRSNYLAKISRGELAWDVETYNWIMDDRMMEKVVLQSMTKNGPLEEVTILTLTDGRPGPATRFVQTGLQNVKGDISGVFYKEEVKLLPTKEYASLRLGHDPDNPALFGVAEPARKCWDPEGDAFAERDLVLEEALYGSSDSRTPTLEETLPEREYPADWLWIPDVGRVPVPVVNKSVDKRILKTKDVVAFAKAAISRPRPQVVEEEVVEVVVDATYAYSPTVVRHAPIGVVEA